MTRSARSSTIAAGHGRSDPSGNLALATVHPNTFPSARIAMRRAPASSHWSRTIETA